MIFGLYLWTHCANFYSLTWSSFLYSFILSTYAWPRGANFSSVYWDISCCIVCRVQWSRKSYRIFVFGFAQRLKTQFINSSSLFIDQPHNRPHSYSDSARPYYADWVVRVPSFVIYSSPRNKYAAFHVMHIVLGGEGEYAESALDFFY
jgi:hypothetical protein